MCVWGLWEDLFCIVFLYLELENNRALLLASQVVSTTKLKPQLYMYLFLCRHILIPFALECVCVCRGHSAVHVDLKLAMLLKLMAIPLGEHFK